jgi:hypothetical protein
VPNKEFGVSDLYTRTVAALYVFAVVSIAFCTDNERVPDKSVIKFGSAGVYGPVGFAGVACPKTLAVVPVFFVDNAIYPTLAAITISNITRRFEVDFAFIFIITCLSLFQ